MQHQLLEFLLDQTKGRESLDGARFEGYDDGSLNLVFEHKNREWRVWMKPWESWLLVMAPVRWGVDTDEQWLRRVMRINRNAGLLRFAIRENFVCLRGELPLREPAVYTSGGLLEMLLGEFKEHLDWLGLEEQPRMEGDE